MNELNYTMLCDFYELTMGTATFSVTCIKNNVFDVFFREVPDGGGFAIAAGLEQVIDYIQNLRFDKKDIEFLRSKGGFDERFLRWLKYFKFTGDIWQFRREPWCFPASRLLLSGHLRLRQLIETYLLLAINHQSLIATKANRVVRAAQAGLCLSSVPAELRVTGNNRARAAYRGCAGTACTVLSSCSASGRRHYGTFLGSDV